MGDDPIIWHRSSSSYFCKLYVVIVFLYTPAFKQLLAEIYLGSLIWGGWGPHKCFKTLFLPPAPPPVPINLTSLALQWGRNAVSADCTMDWNQLLSSRLRNVLQLIPTKDSLEPTTVFFHWIHSLYLLYKWNIHSQVHRVLNFVFVIWYFLVCYCSALIL